MSFTDMFCMIPNMIMMKLTRVPIPRFMYSTAYLIARDTYFTPFSMYSPFDSRRLFNIQLATRISESHIYSEPISL